jgi:hypothetical protein
MDIQTTEQTDIDEIEDGDSISLPDSDRTSVVEPNKRIFTKKHHDTLARVIAIMNLSDSFRRDVALTLSYYLGADNSSFDMYKFMKDCQVDFT